MKPAFLFPLFSAFFFYSDHVYTYLFINFGHIGLKILSNLVN